MGTPAVPQRSNILGRHIAALLLLAPPTAMAATTWTVDTCADFYLGDPVAHTGSLRYAAANAAGGDTIDLSHLSCSVISLQNGAIDLAQDDITLIGPDANGLTISGKYGVAQIEHDRIISHTGNGWLKLHDLSVRYGYIDVNSQDVDGGCIRSLANIELNNVEVSDCRTYANNGSGGGIAAGGVLWLLDSKISNNTAGEEHPSAAFATYGGGAYVEGNFVSINSTITHNAVHSSGDGGGLFVRGDASIYYSTISNNSASHHGGGIYAEANATIANSTISDNVAYTSGGIQTVGLITIIKNSTIALNIANVTPGIGLRPYQPMTLTLESSIVANNAQLVNGTLVANDIDRCCGVAQAAITIDGANSIVRAPAINLPPGVATTGVCPLLGPLRNNGGPTRTHALLSTSPGIDDGDAGTFPYDQRGFFRTSGNAADVGAYEIDQDDIIFNNAFDGCP